MNKIYQKKKEEEMLDSWVPRLWGYINLFLIEGVGFIYCPVGIRISYLPFFSCWLFVKIKQNHLHKTALWSINSSKK